MKFRPCIDLHRGQVKQIVGSTLSDDQPEALRTNFVSDRSPAWFAELYRRDNLRGGHIIMLGPGNEAAARQALEAWPGGMQIGGGITAENASYWLEQGASHVIVTSWVFRDGRIDFKRLEQLKSEVGKEHLVLDLSCRLLDGSYYIVTDRWQTFTRTRIAPDTLAELASYCDEYLIHAADVEGKCSGIETALVAILAEYAGLPTTYAGGIRNIEDLEQIRQIGGGRIDATIGSALDIFGGNSITYKAVVSFHQDQQRGSEDHG